MPFEKVSVPNRVFKPHIPGGNCDCHGIFLEAGQERMNFMVQVCWIVPCIRHIMNHRCRLVPKIMPWTDAFIKISSLSLSVSPHLPPSIYLEYCCPVFNCRDPGWHISARIEVQVFTKLFTYNLPYHIKIIFGASGNIPNKPYYPHSSHSQPLHGAPLTTSYELRSTWSHIWLSWSKDFQPRSHEGSCNN